MVRWRARVQQRPHRHAVSAIHARPRWEDNLETHINMLASGQRKLPYKCFSHKVSGFMVEGLGFMVEGLGFLVEGLWFMVEGLVFMV